MFVPVLWQQLVLHQSHAIAPALGQRLQYRVQIVFGNGDQHEARRVDRVSHRLNIGIALDGIKRAPAAQQAAGKYPAQLAGANQHDRWD